MDVRNIYCVGRNYKKHAEELGNDVPEEPLLFMKPTHSLRTEEKAVLPSGQGEVHYEAELVLHIGGMWEKGSRAEDLISGISTGLDLTLRELQQTLKEKGKPWLPAKGFLGSALTGPEQPLPEKELTSLSFSLEINGEEKQLGFTADMIFPIQYLVDTIGRTYGLGPGDVIFTGTPEGVGRIQSGDEAVLYLEGTETGRFTFT
ncbi:fumarylacetoacetate hydrolase family protein [Alkalicoccus urumqiensis]|nr:fumarylacetoacetate hydrolase family protein [Alkalicoccus urumqiensis]